MTGLLKIRSKIAFWAGVTLLGAIPIGATATTRHDALFEKLRGSDFELATIGWRLATANVALCDRLESGLGFQIHTLDQFNPSLREDAAAYFKFATAAAVEAVVPDSPAAKAGIRQDDSIVRIGAIDVALVKGQPGSTDRLVALENAVADLPRDAAVDIQLLRNGAPITVSVHPVPACRSRFELQFTDEFDASADGNMVQVSEKLIDTYRGDRAVAAIAHEFSHNILHHADRLSARGVSFGMLSGFGGSVKYFRQTELQADILSVYLLANAGYRPGAAAEFWRDFGPKHAGGMLRSRSHPYWRDRIATLESETAKIEADPVRPHISTLIAERDQPLDGDWEKLLVRHR